MLKNLLWILFEKSINATIALCSTFFISKGLGVDDFGIYSFNVSVVLSLLAVARVGLNNYVVSKVSKNESGLILVSSFYIKAVFGLACSILLILFLYFFNPKALASSVFYFVLFSYAFEVSSFLLMGQLKFRLISVISIVNNCFFCMVKYYLYSNSFAVSDYLIVYFLQFTTLFLVQTFFVSCYYSGRLGFSFKTINSYTRKLFFTISPVWLAFIFNALYMQSDVLMLGFISTEIETGIYGLASNLMYQLYVIPSVLVSLTLPYLSKASKKNFFNQWKKYHWLGGVGLSLVSIVIYSIFPFLFILLWGEEFRSSIDIVNVLLLNLPLVYLLLSINNFNIITNRFKYNLYTSLIGFFVNVIFNFILIPKLGAYGASLSSFISYLVMIFGVYFVLDKRLVTPWSVINLENQLKDG